MRHPLTPHLVGIVLFAVSASGATRGVIPPRDTRDQRTSRIATASLATLSPVIDRSAAPELARVSAIDSLETRPGDTRLLRDGVLRRIEAPLRLSLPPSGASAQTLASLSVGKVVVENATAVRLRFGGLPEGTVLWIGGSEETLMRFEARANAEWGPTTSGDTVIIAAEDFTGEFVVHEVASVGEVTSQNSACMQDVACTDQQTYPDVEPASRAIAYIRFVRDGQPYVCTGGLLNDASGSGTPYLLTARHCIATQEQAASIEIVWDLKSSACGSNRMAPLSRSHGAELLVASERTDVALLKLNTIPSDRVFLGVDARAVGSGQQIHRVSHASGLSQTYSSALVDADGGSSCSRAPRTHFIYSDPTAGGIAPGSSGAPLLLPGLYVAGQLLGLCGSAPSNPCATFNSVVDGSLHESWPLLAPYLDPAAKPSRRRAVR